MPHTSLKIGFVPLCDSAPLVVARERGFFAEHGLAVDLAREPSWSNLRDKLACGFLDAAQMLATMPLACALGLENLRTDLVAPLGLSCGGNAITLGTGLLAGLDGGAPAALADLPAPPVLAIPYPFSTHHYELRCWLAGAGLDPERQVRLVVVPPPQMVARLSAGQIAGFCVGEPWNSLAVHLGLGRVVAAVRDFLPERLEKVLALRRDRLEGGAPCLEPLLRAVLAACRWCDAPEHRDEVAGILSQPPYLNAPIEVVRAGLERIRFHGDMPNRPDPAQALWYLGQMERAGHVSGAIDKAALAARTYRPDLYGRCVERL